MQNWEYISLLQSISVFGEEVYYISPDGEETEYKGAGTEGKNIHTLLNSFGSEGYELVVATTSATNVGIFSRMWVLKRPKSQIVM
jgi:hypothetical protein